MATIKEQIEIIEAYERGEDIEWKSKYSDYKFIVLQNTNYEFDFQRNEYRIKPKRWRAEKEERYYFINPSFEVVSSSEVYDRVDNNRFNAGNYFRTEEQAEQVSKLLEETLIKFHEELIMNN